VVIPAWRRALPWALTAASAIAAVWLWAPWRAAPESPAPLRLSPLSFEQGGQTAAVWSPDGKALAFGARQRDTEPYQLYVRYLDSPVATKITATPAGIGAVVQWTTGGKIIFWTQRQLWSVSPIGGEPESLEADAERTAARYGGGPPSVTRDGTVTAGLFRGADGVANIWTSQLSDARSTPYDPSPFATKTVTAGTSLKFSPDGRQILLFQDVGVDGIQAWLMPYQASAANPPRRILQGIATARRPPAFSWMPDSRHVVMSASFGGAVDQLYLADTVSSTFAVLSSGTRAQVLPAVSPDGRRLAFLESTTDYDVVAVDLASAVLTPIIATERSEQQPAWAAHDAAMVYVTDRNGAPEIWWHKEGLADRPIVTARDFPAGMASDFATPSLSPDGTRVIYRLVTTGRFGGLWISAVAGGAPVRLTKGPPTREKLGAWSPDGGWFVYLPDENGRET
jgi:Tol biopolymer transport system component